MEYPIIRKKLVRQNKALKIIQKVSRKRYGKVKSTHINAKVNKVVQLKDSEMILNLAKVNQIQEVMEKNPKEILSSIEQSNLTGLSGSGFSTYQKIATVVESKSPVKNLIVNAVECDPGLLHDEWLLHNRMNEIIMGINFLSKCIAFQGVYIASKEAATRKDSKVNYIQVPNRYPMGAERVLIEQVLGKKLQSNQIPAKEGILVLNVQTIIAICEIVLGKEIIDSRYLTVADLTTGEAKIVRANIGENASSVLVKALGDRANKGKYYGGGAMMAEKLSTQDVITAQTNLIAYGESQVYEENTKCKKCGGCSRRCPMGIDVRTIVQLIENGNMEEAKKCNVEQCIHCGTCSYVCYAGKNLTKLVTELKER